MTKKDTGKMSRTMTLGPLVYYKFQSDIKSLPDRQSETSSRHV